MKITDMSELNKSLSYFRDNRSTPRIGKINFNIYTDVGVLDEFHIDWLKDDEDIEFSLAMVYGNMRGISIRFGSGKSFPEFFMWFDSDYNVSYQFELEELLSFPAFLNKVKFAIENYVAFYR